MLLFYFMELRLVGWLVGWCVCLFGFCLFSATGPPSIPGWSQTHYIDTIGFELTDLPTFLPNAGIKGEHHTPPRFNIFSISV